MGWQFLLEKEQNNPPGKLHHDTSTTGSISVFKHLIWNNGSIRIWTLICMPCRKMVTSLVYKKTYLLTWHKRRWQKVTLAVTAYIVMISKFYNLSFHASKWPKRIRCQPKFSVSGSYMHTAHAVQGQFNGLHIVYCLLCYQMPFFSRPHTVSVIHTRRSLTWHRGHSSRCEINIPLPSLI